jgi:glycosyltransferase involved in cell wall biosynthesis
MTPVETPLIKPILQYGSLAAWPYWLAEALKAIDVPSINVIPEETDVRDLNRRLPFHEAICASSTPRLLKVARRAAFLASIPSRFSLVHYHGSQVLRGNKHHVLEGPWLSARKVPMLISFGGGDARIVEQARTRNPYFYRDPDPARDERIRAYLRSVSRHIRYVATDCEMVEYVAPYFEKVFIFRQPLDLRRIAYNLPRLDRPPVFLHVPTEPKVKGTEEIEAAFDTLRREGVPFEFKRMRRLTQTEFYRELAECDVYVDELRCGSYGVSAVEAMAAGKPTVTYIRPDLVKEYPADLPLVNANPDTITAVLRQLAHEHAWRAELSARSRQYVEHYHDSLVVARDMMDIYRQVGLAHG